MRRGGDACMEFRIPSLECWLWLHSPSSPKSPAMSYQIISFATHKCIDRLLRVRSGRTTLSGTPAGGKGRFLGGHTLSYDLLSNLHSPIFP